jgi:hypothetical protein
MRKPGPTNDTTVAHIEYDGAKYLVLFNKDDEVIEVSYRLMRNHAFYGWKSVWKEGDSHPHPKTQIIIDLALKTGDVEDVRATG